MELLDKFGLNLHRIDKDVARCDRNMAYFQQQHNLEKVGWGRNWWSSSRRLWRNNWKRSSKMCFFLQLRNIVTTYVWQNLDVGYMQVNFSFLDNMQFMIMLILLFFCLSNPTKLCQLYAGNYFCQKIVSPKLLSV